MYRINVKKNIRNLLIYNNVYVDKKVINLDNIYYTRFVKLNKLLNSSNDFMNNLCTYVSTITDDSNKIIDDKVEEYNNIKKIIKTIKNDSSYIKSKYLYKYLCRKIQIKYILSDEDIEKFIICALLFQE
jgi:hypothetical protein